MSSATSSIQPLAKNAALPEGVTVSDIKPAVGSYISGYRFDGIAVSDAFQATIRDLIYNRGVIVFEPGTATVENFTKLVGFLGKFMNYDGPHTPRSPENPDATVINAAKDGHLRNHIWHSDGSFRLDAPTFTALLGVVIPEGGGDTMFSSATYVYEQLDPLFAKYLESLSVIQSPDATGHITDRYLDPEEAAKARLRMPPFELPLIRTHPVTGRKWVAVNESYVCYIKGVSRIHSQNILGILFDMIKTADATCRIGWQQGALAVWDNRVVQHRAVKDYSSGTRRILYRCTMNDGS